MKEIKNEIKVTEVIQEQSLRGPGKGKDRQSAVTMRLSKIGLKNKTKQ